MGSLFHSRLVFKSAEAAGQPHIHLAGTTGQATLLRLLLKYTTSQKRHTLTQSQSFNTLKHLLMQRMRHQGQPISVNSLSVTLTRTVKTD